MQFQFNQKNFLIHITQGGIEIESSPVSPPPLAAPTFCTMALTLYDVGVKGSSLKSACYSRNWVLSKTRKTQMGKAAWQPAWTNALLDKSMLLVPEEHYDLFLELYYREQRVCWYLTERTFASGFRYFIDLDIHTGQRVEPGALHAMLARILRIVGSLYHRDDGMHMLVAACEPYMKKGAIKCGYHLLFPEVVTTRAHALCVRQVLLKELKRHAPGFAGIQSKDAWDEILDESVYDDGKGLRMLRAGKCAPCNSLVVQLPNTKGGTTRRTCGRYQDAPALLEHNQLCSKCNNVGTARLEATPYDSKEVYHVSAMPAQVVTREPHPSALGDLGAAWTPEMRRRWSINPRGKAVTPPNLAAYPEVCHTRSWSAEYRARNTERAYLKNASAPRQIKLVGTHMEDGLVDADSAIGQCIHGVLGCIQFEQAGCMSPTFSPYKECYPRKVLLFQPQSSNPSVYQLKAPWAAVHLSGTGSTWCPNKGGYHNSNTVWLHVSADCIRIHCWKKDGACKDYKGHICKGAKARELWQLLKPHTFLGGGPLNAPQPDSPPPPARAAAAAAAVVAAMERGQRLPQAQPMPASMGALFGYF